MGNATHEIRPDSKDYLWEGAIVQVPNPTHPHTMAVMGIADRFRDLYPKSAWHVREEKELVLVHDLHEPRPDVMVLRGPLDSYKALPRPGDVEILVEVSDATGRMDMGVKLAAYASAGIPRYWVADVEGRAILVFEDPDQTAGCYRSSRVVTRGGAAETPQGTVPLNDVFQ